MKHPKELAKLVIDGQEFSVLIEREKGNKSHMTLYYGGIIIPDGPCRGLVKVEEGIITHWQLPNAAGLLPLNGEAIEPYVKGQWRGPLGDWPLD